MRKTFALVLAAITAVVVTLLLAFDVDDTLELPLRDAALRLLAAKPATSVVVVAIDERSIRELGRWPWPRARLAGMIDRAKAALDASYPRLIRSRAGVREIDRGPWGFQFWHRCLVRP